MRRVRVVTSPSGLAVGASVSITRGTSDPFRGGLTDSISLPEWVVPFCRFAQQASTIKVKYLEDLAVWNTIPCKSTRGTAELTNSQQRNVSIHDQQRVEEAENRMS